MHKTTKLLLLESVLIVLSAALMIPIHFGHRVPLPFPYPWHKWLHILGGILFLGNLFVTGFWMYAIERTKNEGMIRQGILLVCWADIFFTTPGVILLYANGILLSQSFGGMSAHAWIRIAVQFFLFSGLLWACYLVPIQDRMARMAESPQPLDARFFRYLHKWYFWGIISSLAPVCSMILMVTKPGG